MSTQNITESRTSPATEGTRGPATGRRNNKSRAGNANALSNNDNRESSSRNARSNGNKKGNQKEAQNKSKGQVVDNALKIDTKVGNETSKLVEQLQLSALALSEGGDMDVCWICAESVQFYAVPPCNHRTCHVCAIRLKALYKKGDCTFCKEPLTNIIFTVSPDAPYSSFTPEFIPHKDAKLSVFFETQEMMEETLILLRFNCPDPECDYIGNGWGDLRLHARALHGKLMCDLCIRNKKVFSHEHTLYLPSLLAAHLPSVNIRANKSVQPPDGMMVHPLCQFCRECFYGDDELFKHMREMHEECFICKRNEVRDHYFQNYESLEKHFNVTHHPCTQPECLARKFVVFNTGLDLKAHLVEDHGGDMSSRDRKDARRIQADFTFEEIGARHGRNNRERDRVRDQDREPPPQQQQQAQTSSGAFPAASSSTRPVPGSRRREGFGGALTEGTPGPSNSSNNPPKPPSPQPATDVDPAVAERHAAFLARLQSLAPNATTAVPAVKSATRSFRNAESSARDLILTFWNILDSNLEHTASIVNAFVDLVDEEDKKQDLLTSWNGFAVEQRRQFPDLTPTSFGTGYAGITSGRVLNAKHSTATRSSQSQQIWNRVALAASNSPVIPATSNLTADSRPLPTMEERFPSIAPSKPTTAPAPAPMFRQNKQSTPWSGSSAQPSVLRAQPVVFPSSTPSASRVGSVKKPPAPKLSSSLFPELPSSSSAKPKPQVSGNVSLKNILGNPSGPSVAAWGASIPAADPGDAVRVEEVSVLDDSSAASKGGKGKKSKGKQKQTLFTLGTFPT